MDARRGLRDQLNEWKGWGVDAVPKVPTLMNADSLATGPVEAGVCPRPYVARIDGRDAILGALAAEIAACTKCVLHKTRKQTVFCSGNPSPLMFVGEAPGADEDAQGEVFVGAAGKLLTRVLKDVGLTRDKVYIANVLKCRPPNNRPPEPEEAAACDPYLRKQIELVNPKVICALGKHAAHSLLGWEGAMRAVRGTWRMLDGRWATATYHPSYLLRTPGDTELVREDLRAILSRLRELGVEL